MSEQARIENVIEVCARRVETYALSLELCQHMGLPDPITALSMAVRKIRELICPACHGTGKLSNDVEPGHCTECGGGGLAALRGKEER